MTSDTKLHRRRLGASGLEAGAIGLGCMGMTWAYNAGERDDDRSIAVIHRALELGMTLIDTADMYGPYTNEAVVGRALAGRREQAVLATKVGIVVEDRETFRALKAPVRRVCAAAVPVPYSPTLERTALPSRDDITAAVYEVLKG